MFNERHTVVISRNAGSILIKPAVISEAYYLNRFANQAQPPGAVAEAARIIGL